MNAVSSEELFQRTDEIDESDGDGPWMKIDSCLSVEVFTQAALSFPPDWETFPFGLSVELNDHRRVGIQVSSLERVAAICVVIKTPMIHIHCDESEDGAAIESALRSLMRNHAVTKH